jgi:hypothetical protein
MQETIYKLLYFCEIGQKITVNSSEIELIWRNLAIYNRALKRRRKFKYDKLTDKYYIIWRTK